MSFDGKTITSSDTVKLVGITLDKNIIVVRNMQNICQKANNRTKVLLHVRKFISLEQATTKTYGLNVTLFKRELLWNKLSNYFKEAKALINFKKKIEEWTAR